MGFLDLLLGRKGPVAGVAPRPPAEVRGALLALDRPTAPYTVRPAAPQEGCDVVAEWRIVDANWYWLLARNGLKKSYTMYMRLDPSRCTLRVLERQATLEWSAGWPSTHVEGEVSWGPVWEKSFGAGIGFTEELRPGVVYSYRFATSEIKGPLQDTVAAMGWTWQSVGLGRL